MFSSNTTAANGAANYIEDVFSTYLYTGNSSTQTITNGIDLAGKGGLVWIKDRAAAFNNELYDTIRGPGWRLISNDTLGNNDNISGVTAFNANGFSVGNAVTVNLSGEPLVSWTFREQAKFFDVVTYTGNSTARTISHSLGSAPGCIIVKATSASGYQWAVYHRSLVAGNIVWLNLTDASTASSNTFTTTAPTATEFSLGTASGVNDNGVTYVAYLFAHNAGGFGLTGTDNVISCGSFTASASETATVTLGYEPEWLLFKPTSTTGDWQIVDTMRRWPVASDAFSLKPNLSNAEANFGAIKPNATGFYATSNLTANATYIYIAIRRGPMKVPTDGTTVFEPKARSGTGGATTVTTTVRPDTVLQNWRSGGLGSANHFMYDRLRGVAQALFTDTTDAESTQTATGINAFNNLSYGIAGAGSMNNGSALYADYVFTRAPGFFDEVCYTGTGAVRTVAHNLAAVPELMIVKNRNDVSGTWNWLTYHSAIGNTSTIYLNSNGTPLAGDGWYNNTTPTSSVFTVGTYGQINTSTQNYVAYLFASCPGVSKVGSVTHVEPTTVSCGFTPRFVLLKSTASTGTDDWYVFDSARGITSGNDPYLRLNSTGAENTPFGAADLIDPTADGFIMNGFGGGNYIFLAIA